MPLVNFKNVALFPLYIKLALIKDIVIRMPKALSIWKLFSQLSDDKLKEKIVIGSQIKEVINEKPNKKNMKFEVLLLWNCFIDIKS